MTAAPIPVLTAGVAIDNWKLPIFRRHLDGGGYHYTEHPGLTADAMILKVETTDLNALAVVVKAANTECAKCRKLH